LLLVTKHWRKIRRLDAKAFYACASLEILMKKRATSWCVIRAEQAADRQREKVKKVVAKGYVVCWVRE
jgi:hypothetical protein